MDPQIQPNARIYEEVNKEETESCVDVVFKIVALHIESLYGSQKTPLMMRDPRL